MLSAAAVAAPDADATPTPPAPVSTGAPANGVLPPAVLAALQRANLPVTALAAVALPLADAAVPTLPGTASPRWPRAWGHQAQRSMQPGSTMKVVTSAVALDRLGPNLRGSTELRSAAPLLPDGTLQGDLVLKGGADPELGVAQFWALLLELQAAGVRQVTGDLVVDRTLWRPARADLGVPPFDDAPQWGYNVIPDALQLAHTLLPLRLASDDHSLQADTVPQLPGVKLVSRMTLNDERCAAFGSGWQAATVRREVKSTVIELQGTYPKNCTQRVDLQLLDRQELTEHLFGTLWRQLGGQWLGRAVEAASPPGTRLLARRQARPWGEVLRTVNKSSDNALSRMLFLNLGVSAMDSNAQASTAELARAEVLRWFAEHGISTEGVVVDNGSGLSRSERISPQQLAQVLQVAHRARYAPDLLMSLPVPGVDGTLRNRLKESPAAGWARLKTGTLRNVAALAGYVADNSGQQWAVAMMINHDRAAQGRPALDALIDHIARHGPHPAPAPVWGPQGDGP